MNKDFPLYVKLTSFDETGAEFTTVPIPTAAVLLGTGMLGLIGFRRRLKKK